MFIFSYINNCSGVVFNLRECYQSTLWFSSKLLSRFCVGISCLLIICYSAVVVRLHRVHLLITDILLILLFSPSPSFSFYFFVCCLCSSCLTYPVVCSPGQRLLMFTLRVAMPLDPKRLMSLLHVSFRFVSDRFLFPILIFLPSLPPILFASPSFHPDDITPHLKNIVTHVYLSSPAHANGSLAYHYSLALHVQVSISRQH